MKSQDILLYAGIAFAAYYILKGKPPAINGTLIPNNTTYGQNGYGYKYYTDGTVITPSGQYYKNGVKVWG